MYIYYVCVCVCKKLNLTFISNTKIFSMYIKNLKEKGNNNVKMLKIFRCNYMRIGF